MGDSAQYSASTREPIGLPSISTFTPMIASNNGFRDQHSPRFQPSHTTSSSSMAATAAASSSSSDSRPFSASISFAPLNKQLQPMQLPQPVKREGPPHPTAPPQPSAIYHNEPVQIAKKKSPQKKHSPVPSNGPPPAKKPAPSPLSPPRNGANGGGMPTSALEAALRSPAADRGPPHSGPSGPMMAMGHPGGGPSNMPPRGGQHGPTHQGATASRSLDFSLEGLSPFNPNEECGGPRMQGPTSNGNNGYGYVPSPSNGHRGYFGETPRDSPMAPLEPLTTTFPTHSPAAHNGSNSYFPDWSNPSLASPMTLPPLNTIFSGHPPIDPPQSSTQFSASPMSAYSDPSPNASLLSVSLPHGQQQSQQPAARPQSRTGADYGSQQHYAGPLSHQSTSSIVWEEPPPPPTPTSHAAAAAAHPKAVWTGGGGAMQQQPANSSVSVPMARRPTVRMMPDGKSPRSQDPAYEKVQQILAQSKAAENAAAAQRAAERRGEIPPIGMRVGGEGGKGAREAEKGKIDDPNELEQFEERRAKKRLAQNEARRKKRAEKMEKDRIMAETGQLLLPVRQMLSMPPQQQQGLRPMQQPMMMQQAQLSQPPIRKPTDSGESNCSITESINAVARLDSGVPTDSQRAASNSKSAAAGASCGFSELRAAMLVEERPLVIRKESSSTVLPHPASLAAANPSIMRHLQQPLAARPAHFSAAARKPAATPAMRKLARGVFKARKGLMLEYALSLGHSTSSGTKSQFLEVILATRQVEEAQLQAERELVKMQTRCGLLAEQTRLQHGTLLRHLRTMAAGEDTMGLETRVRQPTVMTERPPFALKTLGLLDDEIACRRAGLDPSSLHRRLSTIAVLKPPVAPSAALRLAPPPPPAPAVQIKTEVQVKVETNTSGTMTEKEEERGEEKPSRRLLNDQSTRPLERVYLAGVKELLAEGYAVREGGSVVRPRETAALRSGNAAGADHLVDTDGRIWSEAPSHSQHRLHNGVQQQRRLNEEGESMDERTSGRVLRSAHRHSSGYH